MSQYAIEIYNLSKRYRLIDAASSKSNKNFWDYIISPYRRFKEIKSLTSFSENDSKDVFWALKDINLNIEHGEVIGLIGKNGAGKSTLLKILSKITAPTTGKAILRGRVNSLLEVGTGFNSELTGRENIYMNGTLHGMSKKEIDKKLDEIIDFAGVEKFIDIPVKRYSSGMGVRLGFAVAAHLEPEILIVDEVLAVGDAEFQKKAVGKMQDVSKKDGRTIILVSHNLQLVRNLCNKGIVLVDGVIKKTDNIINAVNFYTSESTLELKNKSIITDKNRLHKCTKDIELIEVELINDTAIATDEPIKLILTLKKNLNKDEFRVIGMINSNAGERVGLFFSNEIKLPENKEIFEVELYLKNHNLAKGQYYFDFNIGSGNTATGLTDFDIVYETISFEVLYNTFENKDLIVKWESKWGYNCFNNTEIKLL